MVSFGYYLVVDTIDRLGLPLLGLCVIAVVLCFLLLFRECYALRKGL